VDDFEQTNWWAYLDEPMRDLMQQSISLLKVFNTQTLMFNHDYSFIVFGAAKAYEGFLKKLLLDLGLIRGYQYRGEHFRIGRAMSPSLPTRYRHGWVYGKLSGKCGGDEIPRKLWETWKRARNRLFHYFPDHKSLISLGEAGELVTEISTRMDEALQGCQVSGNIRIQR